MIIVADSSPLISLAILSKLELLIKLFDDIFIPEAVFVEITKADKPYSDILTKFANTKVKSIKNKIAGEE